MHKFPFSVYIVICATLLLSVKNVFGQEGNAIKEKNVEYAVYTGMNLRILKPNNIRYVTGLQPLYSFADSTKHNSTVGVHIGGDISFSIYNNLCASIGVEFNRRKYNHTIYADSLVPGTTYTSFLDTYKYTFTTIEVPVSLVYKYKKARIYVGASIIPLANSTIYRLYEGNQISKSTNLILPNDFFFISVINPFLRLSYDIFCTDNYMIDVACKYELLNNSGSLFSLSTKIKFQ